MIRRFAVSCAVALVQAAMFVSGTAHAIPMNSIAVVVPRVDVAAPGQSQTDPNLIAWQTYDDFSGSNLSPTLWEHQAGSVTTGAGGVTLVPASLFEPGHTNASIRAALPVNIGGYFAFRLPFAITAAIVDLPGNVDINIDICGPHPETQCDSVSWVLANSRVPPFGGSPISGKFFARTADGGPFALQPTLISQGELAMIYSGGFITGYIDEGSGWQQLGSAFSPPPAWIPLRFEIDADIDVIIPAQVPEPNSLLLLGVGIAALGIGGCSKRGPCRNQETGDRLSRPTQARSRV